MIKKMVHLWTSFATRGHPDDPTWTPLTLEDHKWAVINNKPLKMAGDKDFEHKVEFVRSMLEVLTGWRDMKIEDHPAIQDMIEKKSQEISEEMDQADQNVDASKLYQPPDIDSNWHEEL